MPACPQCGRELTDGDLFCRGCGHGLSMTAGPAQQAGEARVIATFGPTTGWVGKTITFENQQFLLEEHGPISAEDVIAYDKQGHLAWADEGLRDWVLRVATVRRPGAPMPARKVAQAADDGATTPSSPVETSAAAPRDSTRKRRWVRPAAALIAVFVVVVWATVLAGGLVRDGVGVAFTLLAVGLVVLLVWILVRPGTVGQRLALNVSDQGRGKRLTVIVASLLAVSIAFAALFWWMPHYEVVAPTDKRVILDATPTLTVKVKNHGLFAGTYSASFGVDGIKQANVQMYLSPGEAKSVDLTVPSGTPTGPHLLVLGGAQISAVALRPAAFHVSGLQVDAPVVKIGQDILVSASVKNTGDIPGTFSGVIEANGKGATAQPTKVAPGQNVPLVFMLMRNSAGPCKLQVGDAEKTVMVVKPIRLPNGHILRTSVRGGSASLTITNPLATDAMLLLTRAGRPRTPVLAVYVRAKNKTKVNNVSDGRYIVWDCIGNDWNSYTRDFLTTLKRSRWRAPLVFSTSTKNWTTYSSDASYVYTWRNSQTNWTDWTLTLGMHSGKISKATPARTFPKV